MKKFVALVAVAVAAPAMGDVVVDMGGATLAGGEFIDLTVSNLVGTVTSVEVQFDFGGDSGGLSWASDVLFAIEGDTSYEIGGFDLDAGAVNDLGDWVTIPDSSAAGTYAEAFNTTLNPVAGDVYLLFGNGYAFSSPMSYDRITITLKGVDQIPAPSALALLGLAGLAGRRRRA